MIYYQKQKQKQNTNENKPNQKATDVTDIGGMADAKNRCPHVPESCLMPTNNNIVSLSKINGNPPCSINECDKTVN